MLPAGRISRRRLAGAVAVAVGCALLAVLAINSLSFLNRINQFMQDWEIASVFAPTEPQDPDIIVVAIDEPTLAQFPYRSPVDRQFVSDLLEKLAAHQPRAIGLDLLLDQPTEETKDKALAQTLRSINAPLAVSYIAAASTVTPEQKAFEDAMVPASMRAMADLPTDQFDTARGIFPGAKVDERYIPGFARKIAQDAGAESPNAYQSIVWRGRPPPTETDPNPRPFRQVSALVAGLMPDSWYRGKVILIGSDVTLVDRHRTPFSVILSGDAGQLPGVIIQAHSVSQLLHRKPSPISGWPVDMAIALAMALIGAGLGMIGAYLPLRVAASVTVSLLFWALAIAFFHFTGTIIGMIAPPLAQVAAFFVSDSLGGREARKQRAFIQGAFGRYVSPAIVNRMVEDPSRMSLEGERRVMTYLFSDIQNFTTMSEKMESQELTRLLNAYLDGMTEIVMRHGGMVDKFIGDSVFAIFNAPLDQPDHAKQAVLCMLEMDRFCEAFRREEQARGIPLGVTRIGVHTGPAVVGNFGSQARFTYTAQGDAVNAASRLEAINKHFGTRLCVSQDTRSLCDGIAFRPIASVVLKGKTEALDLWEPLQDGALAADYLDAYCAAYEQLRREAPEAAALFAALAGTDPHDVCVALHRARLDQGERGTRMVMAEK
jgi:adenylate cyclase